MKKDKDLELLKQGAQLGGGVAAGAGLKGALNSILSGKAGAVTRMLPKALGRSTAAGAIGASLLPEDISKGSTEAERKLEMGEPMYDEDYRELDRMKAESFKGSLDEEERAKARHELNKMVIGRDIDKQMAEEEEFQEPDGGISPEEAREMEIERMLEKLRMLNV